MILNSWNDTQIFSHATLDWRFCWVFENLFWETIFSHAAQVIGRNGDSFLLQWGKNHCTIGITSNWYVQLVSPCNWFMLGIRKFVLRDDLLSRHSRHGVYVGDWNIYYLMITKSSFRGGVFTAPNSTKHCTNTVKNTVIFFSERRSFLTPLRTSTYGGD